MLALITGTALQSVLPDPVKTTTWNTPFGAPSAPVLEIALGGSNVLALPRHGLQGQTAAHLVNYRANMWCLRELGATQVIAVATVGGINVSLKRGDLVVPDQVIDYTHGREQSYVGYSKISHFDFTYPFSAGIRESLKQSLPDNCRTESHLASTYAVLQGPRLETAAEIAKYGKDGCDLAGMTLMPEASLARELEMEYGALCLVVNPAAGIEEEGVDLADTAVVTTNSLETLRSVLERAIQLLN